MPTENQTANRGYQLPYAGNDLSVDIARLIAALVKIDEDMAVALIVAAGVASLDSPPFEGTPTAPTAAPGTSTTQLATTAFVQAALNALVNAAPGALDTLNELAAALGDDPDFASTITALIAAKADADHNHDGRYYTEDEADAAFAPVARTISAGTGLSGGGDLSTDRTLALADMVQATVKGRAAGAGTGAPGDLDGAALAAIVAAFAGDAGAGGAKGAVPAPAAGDAAAGKFLRADGTWAEPSGGGLVLISDQQPTSNVNAITVTGLSAYDLVRMDFALTAVGGVTVYLEGRASGGTWRVMMANSVIDTSDRSIAGVLHVSGFGGAYEKVGFCAFDMALSALDDSDGYFANGGYSGGPKGIFASYFESWDEIRIRFGAGNYIVGGTADQRGRVRVYAEGDA